MIADSERIDRNRHELLDAGLDAFVCARPMNVLMLSGYWPVIGNALCIYTSSGDVHLIVPEDEKIFAEKSWASNITTFSPGSLDRIESLLNTIWTPLVNGFATLGLGGARLGFESGPVHVPASYAAINVYGEALPELLKSILPRASFFIADRHLARLRSTLTQTEISKVKTACSIAATAFEKGRNQLRQGISEREAANAFRDRLSAPDAFDSAARADGQAFCMSGPNSYHAAAAYQHSGSRRLETGDLALIHCNSYVDGFWTDITRTYVLGKPDDFQAKIFDTIFEARQTSLAEIKPGVRASCVDDAARSVMQEGGFGPQFRHGLGHAVGFHAIDHNAVPRLHPLSPDVLETGMVFNVEPAVYIENYGGVRHCDMVAVTHNGSELLTPFQCTANEIFVISSE